MEQTQELPLSVIVFPKKLPSHESFYKRKKKTALACEVLNMACLHLGMARPLDLLIALQLTSSHFVQVKLFSDLDSMLPEDLSPVFLSNCIITQAQKPY